MRWFPRTQPYLTTALMLGFVLNAPSSYAENTGDTPRFFGGRTVIQAVDDSKASVIEFQRRSISPVITSLEEQTALMNRLYCKVI